MIRSFSLSRRALMAGAVASGTAAIGGLGHAFELKNPVVGKIQAPADLNIPHADLRPEIAKRGLIPRVQRASLCTSYATAFLIAYMQKLDNEAGVAPYASAEYVSWAALGGTLTANQSSKFEDVANGYAKFGAVAEADFPAEGAFTTGRKPSDKVIEIGKAQRRLKADIFRENNGKYGIEPSHFAKIKDYLNKGIPIAAGLRLTEDPPLVDYGSVFAVQMLSETMPTYGHSVAIVGYQDVPNDRFGGGGYFIAYNHGGPNWVNPGFKPQEGYFFLSYAYFGRNTADLIAFLPLAPGETFIRKGGTVSATRTNLPDAPLSIIAKHVK